jgi:glycosyltransferase involved in cell wall biosynthesis
MKIAYITSVYGRASDTFIRNEVIELRERGHEVFTFSIRREQTQGTIIPEVATAQATTDYILEKKLILLVLSLCKAFIRSPKRLVEVFALAWKIHTPGLKGFLKQYIYIIEAVYLAERLRVLGVEIVHNHIAENSANVTLLAAHLSGVPYSMTVHGPGIFFHPQEWALGDKIARSAFTATITNFCKSQCMLFSEPKFWYKLHIVRCAVGRSFEITRFQAIPEAPRLVFVGRLSPEKGLSILLEAVSQYVSAGNLCELVLIGSGPMRAEIETLIEQRSLQNSISLLGAKSSQEVRDEIERSRALVLPSFAEGLPVVIMEAFALGRPVITTQIAGIPELVINGENGWLVPPGSVEKLVQAIGELNRKSPAELELMGAKGAAQLQELHQFSHEIDKLEALFKQAVNPA